MNTKLIIVCLLVSFLINSSFGCQCYAGIGLKCGHQDGMEGNCDPNHIYHCQELGVKLFEMRKKANRTEPLSADSRTEPIREPLIPCQNRIEPNRGYPRITAKNLI